MREASATATGPGRLPFVITLPLLMAAFLALVPVLGTSARLLVLLVWVPLAVWSAFADTERALYVLCAWCWMDGTIRGLFGGGPVWVLARDAVLLLTVLGWGMDRLRDQVRNPVRLPPGSLLVGLFTLNCLLQIANPNALSLLGSVAALKLHLVAIPLLFLGYDVFRRREQVRAFFLFLTLATLVIALVSVAQYVQGPGWTYAHFPGTREVISQDVGLNATSHARNLTFKPPGTTTFGGGTNAFVSFAVPLAFALLLLRRPRRAAWVKVGLVGGLFVFTIALFLNGVRSGLVSAAACLLACSLLAGGRQRGRLLAATGLCLVLGFGAWTYAQGLSGGHVAGRFASTFANPVEAMHQDRQTFFDQITVLAVQSPMGAGLGRVGPGSGQFGLDPEGDFAAVYFSESYLGCMVIETGILGALLIAAIALSFLGRGLLIVRSLPDADDRLMASALVSILLVLFLNFFTAPVLFQPPGTILFWLGAGLLLRAFGPMSNKGFTP